MSIAVTVRDRRLDRAVTGAPITTVALAHAGPADMGKLQHPAEMPVPKSEE